MSCIPRGKEEFRLDFNQIYRKAGIRIVCHRRFKQYTQQELALKAGISISYLSRIERGVYTSGVPISTYMKIAKVLDLKMAQLFRDDDTI